LIEAELPPNDCGKSQIHTKNARLWKKRTSRALYCNIMEGRKRFSLLESSILCPHERVLGCLPEELANREEVLQIYTAKEGYYSEGKIIHV